MEGMDQNLKQMEELERNQKQQAENLADLESSVAVLDSKLDGVSKQNIENMVVLDKRMDEIVNSLKETTHKPAQVFMGGMGILLTMMAIMGTFYIQDMNEINRKTEAQGIALLHHQADTPNAREIDLIRKNLQLQIKYNTKVIGEIKNHGD